MISTNSLYDDILSGYPPVENDPNLSFKTEDDSSTKLIATKCDELKDLLISKNLKYGDSALNPSRIFSSASTIEQLKVRIDDKINRIKNSGVLSNDEDTVMDLAGYLILLRIALDNQSNIV
jgi:hypothetical protein